ncbi:hypothetical protein BLNAU_17028 [Blattamonas nauphoetae]|uniref:Uncharacterized protein n=1 Tax=Blattamonas nauphoetae TaxID=2049346 RepID=A0ABQ9X7U7_9EUKA|nr:hypothetical protein BLNAU_17028 [Blattamonas nauphoetae]
MYRDLSRSVDYCRRSPKTGHAKSHVPQIQFETTIISVFCTKEVETKTCSFDRIWGGYVKAINVANMSIGSSTFHSNKDPTDFDDRLSGFGCSVNAERVEHVEMNGLKSVNNTAEMNFQPSPRKQPQPLIQRRERCHRHLYNSDAGMWEGYDQTSLSRLMVSPQTSLRDWRKDDEGPLSSKQENKAPKQIDSDYLQTRDMFLPRFG